MNQERRRDVFHERANHEDILHTRRLGLFFTFNSFLAVAVGLQDDYSVRIILAFLGLVLDVLWLIWARNAGIFVRALRDAGKLRADEKLWDAKIRAMDEKLKGVFAPFTILNYWIPGILICAWSVIIIISIF